MAALLEGLAMTMLLRIQAALAGVPGRRLQGYRLAALSGVPLKKFQKRAAIFVRLGQLSRDKVRTDGNAFYWYSLDDRQMAVFQHRQALDEAKAGKDIALVADVEGLPARLAFLRMLKEKTVFGEHAMLALVIADYERTQRLRNTAAG
ncbi:hypothetical protein AKG95_06960 [Janthinobacterium lividum]|uniref:Uncharacterized protein n=2 Tax=Janthinobacterium lividum TaxID=29581 RepID=A0A1S1UAF7_9BURK|nr:hypothetical protein AKG95_06960 [Janthinobacterium lividum]